MARRFFDHAYPDFSAIKGECLYVTPWMLRFYGGSIKCAQNEAEMGLINLPLSTRVGIDRSMTKFPPYKALEMIA